MTQIPKIVQHRLGRDAAASAHPDPDLLTAFAEKALVDRERNQVLAHLSQCADCREIVSLALPETEAAHTAPVPAGTWLRWPVLRWGAAVACAAVVAVVGLNLRHQARPASSPMAANEVELISRERDAESLAAANNADTAKLADQKKASPSTYLKKDAAPQQRLDTVHPQAATVTAADNAVGGTLPSAPASSTARAVQPPTSESLEVEKDKARVATKSDTRDEDALSKAASVRAAPSPAAMGSFAKAKSAEPEAAKTAAAGAAAQAKQELAQRFSGAAESKLASNMAVIPRWTLSSDGTLQRSLDSGRSWQTIPVASQKAFRAVTALGSEIWVGGAAGSLYHSADAGDHWTQVKPASGDKSLSADIIGIQFTDSQHGKLTTANGESWLTSDSGQSWTVIAAH